MLANAIHWNMDPVMFSIGSFNVRWYSVCFLCAFLTAYYVLSRMYKREHVDVRYLDQLTIYFFFATLIGARLGHCLFYEPGYFLTSEHWTEIVWPFHKGKFIGYQGLASHGAAIAILITMYIYWRRFRINIWWVLDRLVMVVALGGFFIRLGNLFNSEIYGVPTSLPWGFIYERNGETVAKHPTQLYESFSYLGVFLVCLWRYCATDAKFKTGTMFGWWLVGLFTIRFLVEFIKNDQVDFEAGMTLNMGQLLSIPFVVGGAVIAWFAHRSAFPQGPFPKGEQYHFKEGKK